MNMKEELKRIIKYGFVDEDISANSRNEYLEFLQRATRTEMHIWHPFAHAHPRVCVSVNGQVAGDIDLLDYSEDNLARFVGKPVAHDLMRQFEHAGEGTIVVPGLIEEYPWRFDADEIRQVGLVRHCGVSVMFETLKARCYIVIRNEEMYTNLFPSTLLNVAEEIKDKFIKAQKNVYYEMGN